MIDIWMQNIFLCICPVLGVSGLKKEDNDNAAQIIGLPRIAYS